MNIKELAGNINVLHIISRLGLLYLFYITGKTYCWLFALVIPTREQTAALTRVTALLGEDLMFNSRQIRLAWSQTMCMSLLEKLCGADKAISGVEAVVILSTRFIATMKNRRKPRSSSKKQPCSHN